MIDLVNILIGIIIGIAVLSMLLLILYCNKIIKEKLFFYSIIGLFCIIFIIDFFVIINSPP